VRLRHDGVVLYFGYDSDVSLTHIPDNGLRLPDSRALYFGDDTDLQIYHTGSAGFINNATGDLTVDVAGDIILDAAGNDIIFKANGTAIGTFANNSNNLRIVSNVSDADIILRGVDGGSAIDAVTVDMSDAGTAKFNHDIKLENDGAILYFGADNDVYLEHVHDQGLRMPDGDKLSFGTSDDLIIYHDGSNSALTHSGDGDFYVQSDQFYFRSASTSENMITATVNAGVNLYFNAVDVFRTLADGWQTNDNLIGKFGSSGDLQIYHDQTNSVIFNQTGEMRIRAGTFRVVNAAESETQINAVQDAGVAIYYNNDTKMETGDKGAHFPEAIIIASEGNNVNGLYKQYVRALGDDPSNVDLVDITLPNYATASVKVRVTGRGSSALATQHHSEQTYAMSTDTSSVNVHSGTQVDIDTAFTLAVTTSGKNVTIDATASNCGGTQAYVEILTNAAFTDNLS